MREKRKARESSGFVMFFREEIEEVLSRTLDVEGFGFLSCVRLLVNPHTGYATENFSTLSEKLGLSIEKTRYLSKKLCRMGKIHYQMRQGQKGLTRFYVLGFEMVNGSVVSMDSITSHKPSKMMQNFSEVKRSFTKSEGQVRSGNEKNCNAPIFSLSEVSYKEKEIEKEREKKKQQKKSLKDYNLDFLKEIHNSLKSDEAFKSRLLRDGYPLEEIDNFLYSLKENGS